MSALSISVSGMKAAAARLDAVAANVANVATSGTPPGPNGPGTVYQPVDVVTVSSADSGSGAGVGYRFVRNAAAYDLAYDPTSPNAGPSGMVATPRIDIAGQVVDMLYAKVQFEASAKVARAAADLQQTAIDILA